MTSILTKIPSVTGILSSDAGFLLAIFIFILGLSFFIGRSAIVSVILSFYPTTLLFKTFPFMEQATFLKGDLLIVFNKIGIFLLFLIPITIIIGRFIFSRSEYGRGDSFLRILGLSVALLILVVSFSYNVSNYDVIHDFGPQIDQLFGISESQFYWNLAPIALMAFL
ncbi:MAG: hypothetical protein WAW92_04755 [Minisyncoccia bacterium]